MLENRRRKRLHDLFSYFPPSYHNDVNGKIEQERERDEFILKLRKTVKLDEKKLEKIIFTSFVYFAKAKLFLCK